MRVKNCPDFKHILLGISLVTLTACSSATPSFYTQSVHAGDSTLNTALLQSRLHDMRKNGVYHRPQRPVAPIVEPISPFLAGAQEEARDRFNPEIKTAPQNSYVRRSSISSSASGGYGLRYYSIPTSSP